MWLYDERYVSKQRAAQIQSELTPILECLTPGGKILVKDMQELLRQYSPDLEASPRQLGDAMRALTGSASKTINGISYYLGVQLPLRDDPTIAALNL